jgi:hypothetical protein
MSLAPSAFGTSPKFGMKSLCTIQNSGIEFGRGWEGAGVRVLMRNYVIREVS